jgi:SagB-type dehydrogenase family enzyme
VRELPGTTDTERVLAYHERTKHHPGRFAASLGFLDWDTQPDPFRSFDGARVLRLDRPGETSEPSYDALFGVPLPARPLDARSISALLFDSLALSAWKAAGSSRWSLRVNPSSGNLHPTEAYLALPPLPGVNERATIAHYAPLLHALEQRAEIAPEAWESLSAGLPAGSFLIGLFSIHWRESWKYGERAFRYCQHDVGHTIGALSLAARELGWEVRVLLGPSDDDVARLFGLQDLEGPEAEAADCLLAVLTGEDREMDPGWFPPEESLSRLESSGWAGRPNRLSTEHHHWPVIEEIHQACRRRGHAPLEAPAPPKTTWLENDRGLPARRIIRGRRSAVEMDGQARLPREAFYRLLRRLLPTGVPFSAWPCSPTVHLALFVHRVEGLPPGLFLLPRHPKAIPALSSALRSDFAWEPAPGLPEGLELFLLQPGDLRGPAGALSCGQAIAADGVFSVAMLSGFRDSLERHGPWSYRGQHWEAGLIGQVLYLEAEAAGLRGTGIGCFFDDAVHELLGIVGHGFQSLYHFAVGGGVDDPRLQSLPAYPD